VVDEGSGVLEGQADCGRIERLFLPLPQGPPPVDRSVDSQVTTRWSRAV